jgi:D-alanine transfer protein
LQKPAEQVSSPLHSCLHVLAAGTAVLLAVATLAGWVSHARGIERDSIHQLATHRIKQTALGGALQKEAFRQADLLPVYGASELNPTREFDHHYHGIQIFARYPTGFTMFPIGSDGTACLTILERLAAVGSELEGKKVAVSVATPGWFFDREMVDARAYAGNFSLLQASELMYSTLLSYDLKQAAARRMLDYPSTVDKNPLLAFGVRQLADDSLGSRLLYYLALPLGKLQNVVLRFQDHWETLNQIDALQDDEENVSLDGPQAPLDWAGMAERAQTEYARLASNNRYGFGNSLWRRDFQKQDTNPNTKLNDVTFLKGLHNSKEWVDLDLLLRALEEFGAKPLILSAPLHLRWYGSRGVSARAMAMYTQKLHEAVAAHNAPLQDFAEHGNERYFLRDYWGHLSPKGWVYLAHELDDFFHGTHSALAVVSEDRVHVATAAKPKVGGPPEYEGFHDTADGQRITGWAYDRNRPNDPLKVDIYDGTRLLATVLADQFRPGLLDTGRGNGKHAFIYPTPASLKDGKDHVIRVRIAGTKFDLAKTPKTLHGS